MRAQNLLRSAIFTSLLLSAMLPRSAAAQPYLFHHQKVFDPSASSNIRALEHTFDSGYAFAGWYDRFDTYPTEKVILSKLDGAFQVDWTRAYLTLQELVDPTSPPVFIQAHDVFQTRDEGYILCGQFFEEGPRSGAFLLKTDPLGDVEWFQVYPGIDTLVSVLQHVDASGVIRYMTCGSVELVPNQDAAAVVLQTDELGAPVWKKEVTGTKYSIAGWTWFHQIIPYKENFFALVGSANRDTANQDQDILVTIIDLKGAFILNETFGLYLDELGNGIQESGLSIARTGDGTGDLIVAGDIRSVCVGVCTEPNYEGLLVMRVRADGTVVWTHRYLHPYFTGYASRVIVSRDHRIFVGGTVRINFTPTPIHYAMLLETDLGGSVQSFELFGGKRDDRVNDLVENGDGNIVLIGNTESFSPANNQVYLIERYDATLWRCKSARIGIPAYAMQTPSLKALASTQEESPIQIDVVALDVELAEDILCRKVNFGIQVDPDPIDLEGGIS